jgi:hypothetical protein
MKLQELIEQTDLEMSPDQIKAFLLGTLCAEKPLSFPKAMDELLAETPDSKPVLEAELKNVFSKLGSHLAKGLKDMFPQENNIRKYLEVAKDQLDYFLMGMSLAGTSIDNCKDQDFAAFLEEMEDCLEDMEDYLSEKSPEETEGTALKEFLLEAWEGFIESKQSN